MKYQINMAYKHFKNNKNYEYKLFGPSLLTGPRNN